MGLSTAWCPSRCPVSPRFRRACSKPGEIAKRDISRGVWGNLSTIPARVPSSRVWCRPQLQRAHHQSRSRRPRRTHRTAARRRPPAGVDHLCDGRRPPFCPMKTNLLGVSSLVTELKKNTAVTAAKAKAPATHRRRGRRGKSVYRGVCVTREGKWRAVIYKERKQVRAASP